MSPVRSVRNLQWNHRAFDAAPGAGLFFGAEPAGGVEVLSGFAGALAVVPLALASGSGATVKKGFDTILVFFAVTLDCQRRPA